MDDQGSSVTLIFYRIQPKWWREPALNVISAAAQMSTLTHCEIAIGGSVQFLFQTRLAAFENGIPCVRRGGGAERHHEARCAHLQRRRRCVVPHRAATQTAARLTPYGATLCRRGARRAHGAQPAEHLPAAGLLEARRAPDALVREEPLRGQALLQPGNVPLAALAAADGLPVVFLCGYAYAQTAMRGAFPLTFRVLCAQSSSPPSSRRAG